MSIYILCCGLTLLTIAAHSSTSKMFSVLGFHINLQMYDSSTVFVHTLQNQKEAHTIIALCEILGSDGITLFPDRSNRQRNHCDLQTNESESLGDRLIWPCVPDLWLCRCCQCTCLNIITKKLAFSHLSSAAKIDLMSKYVVH